MAMADCGFDAANRLITAGAQSFTYDASGNLTGDASQTYVWNAREQLVQIKNRAATVLSSFTYDALGRRQTKMVNGIGSGYVYDAMNIVQELSSTSVDNSAAANVRASYISGGIDEVFAQQSWLQCDSRGGDLPDRCAGVSDRADRCCGHQGGRLHLWTVCGDDSGCDRECSAECSSQQSISVHGAGKRWQWGALLPDAVLLAGDGTVYQQRSDWAGGGINTYGYVEGNPVSREDPTGKSWFPASTVLGGAACYAIAKKIGRSYEAEQETKWVLN